VLTPEGRISHYLFGVEYAPKDLRLALVDAAGGRIGTPVDQLLLYCYQYDPQTGRYSAAILNLVRAGGALTVLGLGAFILAASRRRRSPAPPVGTPGER
jgi:protein SCO1/2